MIRSEKAKKVIPPKRSLRFVFRPWGGDCWINCVCGGGEEAEEADDGDGGVFFCVEEEEISCVLAGLELGLGLVPPQPKKESIVVVMDRSCSFWESRWEEKRRGYCEAGTKEADEF